VSYWRQGSRRWSTSQASDADTVEAIRLGYEVQFEVVLLGDRKRYV
jgi:hypothetical protein